MQLHLHVGETSSQVEVVQQGEDLVLDRPTVLDATGWEVKDFGLCRGEVCRPAQLGETLTLTELADALGRPLALEVDGDMSVAVLGAPGGPTVRRAALAPDVGLPDADGSQVDLPRRGGRPVLAAWSPGWGCRYELPA